MQTSTHTELVLALDRGTVTLDLAGGKGASLTAMATAGLPVPAGFIVTTEAYWQFLSENDLDAIIAEAVSRFNGADPTSWDRAAIAIQSAFTTAAIPEDVTRAARQGYAVLATAQAVGRLAVAVRSSATAEDLPGASFAGQQETFLHVRGADALVEAIRRCWASLWTARALAYRHRLGIDHGSVAMAVIVQAMVPADIAGVLFTANPTTGERSEIVVNASFGLGEAIVSGQVTPDTYMVDRASGAVSLSQLGTKETMVVAAADTGNGPDSAGAQGTASLDVPEARRSERALSDERLDVLVSLALQVEQLSGGTPQDIEWAVAGDRCWLLQARPITGLPPQPLQDVSWEPPIPGSRWIRRQIVEHMPEPLSPLFDDLYLHQGLDQSIRAVVGTLGITGALDEIVEPPLFATVNGFAYQRADVRLTWGTALTLLRYTTQAIPMLFRVSIQNWRDGGLPRYLAAIAPWTLVDPASEPDDRLLQGIRDLAFADARYWFAAALVIGAAKVSDSILTTFLEKVVRDPRLSRGRLLQALSRRGLESDAALERIADLVRGSDTLRALVATTPPERLREALVGSGEGDAVREALDAYFERFGHLIYSLDFAVPTQIDDPLPVLVTLRALAQGPGRDPGVRFDRLASERETLTRSAWRSLDPLRRRLFRVMVGWARRYAPYREEALFYVGMAWPTLRRLALELGRRLTEASLLERADDVFFLDAAELAAASTARTAGTDRTDLARLARQRRDLREARKRLVPPPAVPPTYKFQLGPLDLSSRESVRRNAAGDRTLRGFAVSPGRVAAPARVILSPADFGSMQPGSILVCPMTTPAWTPLFSQAQALVTDIGGVLAHGSIVAREYGIPAVMGVGDATQRIRSGQTVTVDGDTGTVTLE